MFLKEEILPSTEIPYLFLEDVSKRWFESRDMNLIQIILQVGSEKGAEVGSDDKISDSVEL